MDKAPVINSGDDCLIVCPIRLKKIISAPGDLLSRYGGGRVRSFYFRIRQLKAPKIVLEKFRAGGTET